MTKWSVTDRRRGRKRIASKKGWLGWLCNPLVLKAIIAVARAIYELARVFLRH